MFTTIINYFETIKLDLLTFIVMIIIAILGWIIGIWRQRRQHRFNIMYDIYKQFTKLFIEVQDSLTKLGGIYSPFFLMDSYRIAFELKISSEQKFISKGEQEWTKFCDESFDLYFDYNNKTKNLSHLLENWQATFKPVLLAKNILLQEIENSRKKIYINLKNLKNYKRKYGNDWREWNRSEIEKFIKSTSDISMDISMYLNDFKTLLHNDLLSKYFKHKIGVRKTLSSEYKILTNKGIIINLDYKWMKKMKKKHAGKIQDKLNEINNSDKIDIKYKKLSRYICPECDNKIEIINFKEEENDFLFEYECGHSWKEKKLLSNSRKNKKIF